MTIKARTNKAMTRHLIILLAMCGMLAKPAAAAEISETGKDVTAISECSMVVTGEIEKGDASRIEVLLAKWQERQPRANYERKYAGLDYIVCLSGRGDDYHEAIKIAEVFVKNVVTTSVPVGGSCLSACAIAFMGGRDCCVELGRTMIKRHLSANSTLGLGAPTLTPGQETFTSKEISETFDRSLDVMTALQNKSEDLGVGTKIVNTLIAHRAGNYHLIKPDPGYKHNFLNADGVVFQDIWIPGFNRRGIPGNKIK